MQWDRQDDKSASASSRTFNLSSGLLVLSAVGQQGGGTQGDYRCHHHLACHLTFAHLSHPHSRRDVEPREKALDCMSGSGWVRKLGGRKEDDASTLPEIKDAADFRFSSTS